MCRSGVIYHWRGLGWTRETKNALHDFRSGVKGVDTIVLAGGGATGIEVEVAGKLGFEYG